jgi:hypothetical protein
MKQDKQYKNQVYRIHTHTYDNLTGDRYNQAYNIKMPVVIKRGKIYIEHFAITYDDPAFLDNIGTIFIVSTSLSLQYQFTTGQLKQNILATIPVTNEGKAITHNASPSEIFVHHHLLTTEDIGRQLPDNLSLDNFYFSFSLLDQFNQPLSAKNGDYATNVYMTFVIVDEEPNPMITIA